MIDTPPTDAEAPDDPRSLEVYRWLSLVSPAGVSRHLRDGSLVEADDRWAELTGALAADVAGAVWLDLFHTDDRMAIAATFAEAARLGSQTLTRARLRHPERGYRWLEIQVAPMVDEMGWQVGALATFTDVTGEVKSRQQAGRVISAVEDTTDLVVIVEANGRLLFANSAARRALGVPTDMSAGALSGIDPRRFFPDWIRHRYEREVLAELRAGRTWSGEVSILQADGDELPLSLVLVAHRGDAGQAEWVSAIGRDLSERKGLEDRLTHQATHDALTGLPNRVLLLDRLKMAMARHVRNRAPVAVLFCDLDHFKVVNDSLGHDAGDTLLRTMAERIGEAVRPTDTVARFGGDEFVILCDQLADEDDAVMIAERIAEVIGEPVELGGHEMVLSTSIGIAFCRATHDRPEALIRDADVAMYRAKDRGRNRHEVFDDTMRARALVRLDTERTLRRALERRELRVFYQPVVDIATGAVSGFEALLRWEHPERGLLMPGEFIGLAEETGLIVPIGTWVLNQACRQLQLWRAVFPEAEDLDLAVNLSARQLAQADVVDVVGSALADSGLDPGRLVLEMTESVLMAHAADTIELLRALKGLGVRLAVDDFGTGYSSLAYLRRFPVDILKIDREFVARIGEDPEDTEIVRLVATLAHTLGLESVAEGVERPEQLEVLRSLGCGRAQGFMLHRPLPASGVDDLLSGLHALTPAR